MVKQKRSAGTKEFILAVGIICVMVLLASILGSVFHNEFLGDISGLILFCIYGYFVLVRYGAVYTYIVSDKHIRINRQIGKRNKEAEITKGDIVEITSQKPKVKTTFNFSRFIIKRADTLYIVFNNGGELNAAIVEADAELRGALGKLTSASLK